PQPLPLTLGADFSGVVDAVGPGVTDFARGDEVYGVTGLRFTGAYAELATAPATMIARKPHATGHVETASIPVVAVTAWQMLFDHAHVTRGQRVLVHGGAGNVGAYAVQLARGAGAGDPPLPRADRGSRGSRRARATRRHHPSARGGGDGARNARGAATAAE